MRYPQRCGILVNAREPTEQERWIDFRPGAENPRTPTRRCGVMVADVDDNRRHMSTAHPEIWATIEIVAQARARRLGLRQ